MKTIKFIAMASLVALVGCGAFIDNTRYYGPAFQPKEDAVVLCRARNVHVVEDLDWAITMNEPRGVTRSYCNPDTGSGYEMIYKGRRMGGNWREIDGGGASAGTRYSMRVLFKEDQEQVAKERKDSEGYKYPSYYRDEVLSDFVSNGLQWKHVITRRYKTPPESWYSGASVDSKSIDYFYDVYIYRHPDGWWLRLQGAFRQEMEGFPEVLASRRETLRKVVETIRIEPKDPARIECGMSDREGDRCRYRWP